MSACEIYKKDNLENKTRTKNSSNTYLLKKTFNTFYIAQIRIEINPCFVLSRIVSFTETMRTIPPWDGNTLFEAMSKHKHLYLSCWGVIILKAGLCVDTIEDEALHIGSVRNSATCAHDTSATLYSTQLFICISRQSEAETRRHCADFSQYRSCTSR